MISDVRMTGGREVVSGRAHEIETDKGDDRDPKGHGDIVDYSGFDTGGPCVFGVVDIEVNLGVLKGPDSVRGDTGTMVVSTVVVDFGQYLFLTQVGDRTLDVTNFGD